jgi:hypothetical protein
VLSRTWRKSRALTIAPPRQSSDSAPRWGGSARHGDAILKTLSRVARSESCADHRSETARLRWIALTTSYPGGYSA